MATPKHIAIIMDGNGRWARQNALPRSAGHEKGAEQVRAVVDTCVELEIPFLTLYAFSSENWGRPKAEVDALMALLVSFLEGELPRMKEHNIRLHAIGRIDQLPPSAHKTLLHCLKQTEKNAGLTLTLALSYGGRDELLRAARKLAKKVDNGEMTLAEISEEVLSESLDTSGIPDPDLLIRTSGEKRLSNFLLWQCAYTEFYFTDILWPDFDREALFEALNDFRNRDRRYGLTGQAED